MRKVTNGHPSNSRDPQRDPPNLDSHSRHGTRRRDHTYPNQLHLWFERIGERGQHLSFL